MLTVVFDFDGVLVDSYCCLRRVYKHLREKYVNKNHDVFVDTMLYLEGITDYLGIWSRKRIFKFIAEGFGIDYKLINDLVREYWRVRTQLSLVNSDAHNVLGKIRGLGCEIYCVCGCDDTVHGKIERISYSGFQKYFKKIIIYGFKSSFNTLREALLSIINRGDTVVYVDDKPSNLNSIADLRIIRVLCKFRPSLPVTFSWNEKVNCEAKVIENLNELITILKALL